MGVRLRAAVAFGVASALAACGLSLTGELVTPVAEGGVPEASLPEGAMPGDDAGDAGVDCGDVGSDPANCGACGRSCLGGACADGGCAPFVVASGLGDVCAVSISATDVYFAENTSGLLRRVPLAGGAVTNVHDTGAAPADIAFDGDRVFWGDQHGAGYAMIGTTTSGTTMSVPGGARAILRAGAGLYFIGNDSVHVQDRALSADLAPPIPVTGGQSALAANATQAYFAAGSIERVSLDGGSPVSVVAEPAAMIALDASYVYFT
ncbi:MAG TPA: hypothetical protein VIF62_34935, partial [Labilithrix sp.]